MSTDIAPYQEAVRRLTAETAELHERLAERDTAHREDFRRLTAQLHEGLTPELLALRSELRNWRQRALAAEGRLANLLRGSA